MLKILITLALCILLYKLYKNGSFRQDRAPRNLEESHRILMALFNARLAEIGWSYHLVRTFQKEVAEEDGHWLSKFMQEHLHLCFFNAYSDHDDNHKKENRLKKKALNKFFTHYKDDLNSWDVNIALERKDDIGIAILLSRSENTFVTLQNLRDYGYFHKEINLLTNLYNKLYNGFLYTPFGIGLFKPFYRNAYRKINRLWADIIRKLEVNIQLVKENLAETEVTELEKEIEALETLTWNFNRAISAKNSKESNGVPGKEELFVLKKLKRT